MESLIISGSDFATIRDLTTWMNNLIGTVAPDSSNRVVKRIIQFQVLPLDSAYSVVLLVEVERRKSMSSMVLSMRKDLGLSQEEKGE